MQQIVSHVTDAQGNEVAPEPCGYCRRCAIHDDPGGCLTVAEWERQHPVLAIQGWLASGWAAAYPTAFVSAVGDLLAG